jgi:hypothetical protein
MFVLYAHGHRPPDQYPRDHIVKFPEASQAKVWLQKMEHNLPEGFTIKAQHIDAIRAAADIDWTLPDEYAQWILRFKYGTWDEVHVRDEPEVAEAKDNQHRPRAKLGELEYRYELDDEDEEVIVVHAYFRDKHQNLQRFARVAHEDVA